MKSLKNKRLKKICGHDYKNAIQVGPVDYVCPKCKEIINPNEWFMMNYFDSLGVEVVEVKNKTPKTSCQKKRNT